MNRLTWLALAVPVVFALVSMGCSHVSSEAREERSVGVAVRDISITAAVKVALAFQPGVSALDINVDTDHGTVTLNGDVDSEAERQLAVKVAEDIDGVHEVVNQIQVRG